MMRHRCSRRNRSRSFSKPLAQSDKYAAAPQNAPRDAGDDLVLGQGRVGVKYRWLREIRIDPGGAESLELITHLPGVDNRQRVTRSMNPGAETVDSLGNRRLQLTLADIRANRIELTEHVDVSEARVAFTDLPYPLRASPTVASAFLSEETEFVHHRSPTIQSLAAELSHGVRSCLTVVTEFCRYAQEEIRYDADAMGGMFSDLAALKARAGSCDEKSHVVVSLCRAVGIPAAVAIGLGENEGHAWVEFTLDGRTWVPCEPTYSPIQIGWVDAGHVKTVRGADCAHDRVSCHYAKTLGPDVRLLGAAPSVTRVDPFPAIAPPRPLALAPSPHPANVLVLRGGAAASITCRVRTEVGRHVARAFGDEARFLDERQFVVLPLPTGAWRLEPKPGTTNQTLVNGKACTAAIALRRGDVIAVGNPAKGIIRCPMTVVAD